MCFPCWRLGWNEKQAMETARNNLSSLSLSLTHTHTYTHTLSFSLCSGFRRLKAKLQMWVTLPWCLLLLSFSWTAPPHPTHGRAASTLLWPGFAQKHFATGCKHIFIEWSSALRDWTIFEAQLWNRLMCVTSVETSWINKQVELAWGCLAECVMFRKW